MPYPPDCMTVSSEIGGVYYYESDGRSQPCGLYAVGKPDTKVKLTLKHVDIGNDCDKEVLVVSSNLILCSRDKWLVYVTLYIYIIYQYPNFIVFSPKREEDF